MKILSLVPKSFLTFGPSRQPPIHFTEVPQDERCDFSCEDSRDSKEESMEVIKARVPWLLIAGAVSLSYGISFLFGVCLGRDLVVGGNRFIIDRVSNYSPLLEDIGVSFSTIRFNGSLLRENIYRQEGSPEVDAAWNALGVDHRAFIAPPSLAAKSNLQTNQVQVQSKYGGGYPANIEGLHHLHCLNLLRQSLYFNFDYYYSLKLGAFKNDDQILRFHVTHCLDILRQQLMCNVDIGVLGQVWWDRAKPKAYPDFNTEHKCRNFEAVRKWAEERQAPENPPLDYLTRPRMEDVYETMP